MVFLHFLMKNIAQLLLMPLLFHTGFSYQFTKRFTSGFSKRWKEYVEEFLRGLRR